MLKLQRWALIILGGVVLLSLLVYDEKDLLNPEKLTFHVQESNELYFRNLRRYHYRTEQNENSGFDIYRLKEHQTENLADTTLGFAIVNNWRLDQAYIITELMPSIEDPIMLLAMGEHSISVRIGQLNAEEMLLLAYKVYQNLHAEDASFMLLIKDEQIEIWKDKEERAMLKTVLKDYFRLTDVL